MQLNANIRDVNVNHNAHLKILNGTYRTIKNISESHTG